ncbi:MAG: phosphotransferase family protein [Thermodesulfovibrionales bacterium]
MQKALEKYLREFFGSSVNLIEFKRLGSGVHGAGYLLKIESGGATKSYVLKDLAPEGLGHDYPSDRAGVFLLALDTYGKLPKHVKAIDVISMKQDGTMKSIGGGVEYFLLMETAEGENYFKDLEEFSKKDSLDEIDKKKIEAMTSYLAEIHSNKKDSKTLYWRKLRDTVGHGECLMGVFDSYPDGTLPYNEMAEIIKKSVDWIARLKPKYKRLSQIHGDFHPGNIWFTPFSYPRTQNSELRKETDFILLDRSRGPWGDPADDITALTINYIFFSIKHFGTVKGPYFEGLRLFYERYINISQDNEIFSIVAPFYAFRGAVVANPIFYPELTPEQRGIIFRFVNNVLDDDSFKIEMVNDYLR